MLTFQVLGGKQQAAYVMLLDKRFDMGRDGRAVKAHHEQLAHCPVEIFPDGVKLLRPSHGDHARRFRDDATWGGGWRREA